MKNKGSSNNGVEVEVKGEKNTTRRKKVNKQFDYFDRRSSATTSNPLKEKNNSSNINKDASPPPDQHDSRSIEESETDTEESNGSGSEGEETSWISWFCNLRGNEFFCEVDEDYIHDDFNLCGLSSQIPYYDYALDLILDVETSLDELVTEQQKELVEYAAEMLYGMIHARYILTAKGLSAMALKYKDCDFGRCPRVHCSGQPCIPVGQIDIPRSSTVKIYCPKCEDIFYPRSKHQDVDGAYFGTTFPHLFLMTFPHLKPQKPSQSYVPRIFGYKIHKA